MATLTSPVELGHHGTRVTSPVSLSTLPSKAGFVIFPPVHNQQCETLGRDRLGLWHPPPAPAGILRVSAPEDTTSGPQCDLELSPMSTLYLKAISVDGDGGDVGTEVIPGGKCMGTGLG